jgi:uncharacterized protein YjbI with pentapeptide repeats
MADPLAVAEHSNHQSAQEHAVNSEAENTENVEDTKDDVTQGLTNLREEFKRLCQIDDPLEQSYRLIHAAEHSKLPTDDYRKMFQQFKTEHLSQEHQKNLLKALTQEFSDIARIKDPIEQNYRLMRQAKASEVATEEYRKLFEEYQRRTAEGLGGVVNNSLHRLASLAGFLGQFTIIVGLVLFIAEAGDRKKAAHTQAWNTITAAKSFTESAGRIQAIQTLKEGCTHNDVRPNPQQTSETVNLSPIEWFHPDRWTQMSWHAMPIIGGFFADCVSLRGLDISNAHLPEIDMSWAKLNNARMQDTGLWSANLHGAQLQGAQLQRSKLRNADLRGSNLEGAQLQNADLSGVQLGCITNDSTPLCTILTGANLTGVNLRGDQGRENTVFYTTLGSYIEMADATFTHALYDAQTRVGVCLLDPETVNPNCDETSFMSVREFITHTIDEENLGRYTCPNLPNQSCERARLIEFQDALEDAFRNAYEIGPRAFLRQARLRQAELSNANLSNALMTSADLREAHLQNVTLTQAWLNTADLRNIHLQGANLERANLKNAQLDCLEPPSEKARVTPTCSDLQEANLSGADLSEAELDYANLSETTLTNANLTGADVTGTNFSRAIGWTVEQFQAANNWENAIYDDEQRSQLGLTD